MAQRYCTNCGAELREDDSFCGKCGRPVHETAKVSTSEADVPVPPPPAHDEATAMAGIPQDQAIEPKEWWQTPIGKGLGVIVAIVTVLAILANLAGGEDARSKSERASSQQATQRTPNKASGKHETAQQERPQKKEPLPQKEDQAQGGQQEQQEDGGQKPEPQKPEPQKPSFTTFSNGTYQVGTDIQPGTYRTREGSRQCIESCGFGLCVASRASIVR